MAQQFIQQTSSPTDTPLPAGTTPQQHNLYTPLLLPQGGGYTILPTNARPPLQQTYSQAAPPPGHVYVHPFSYPGHFNPQQQQAVQPGALPQPQYYYPPQQLQPNPIPFQPQTQTSCCSPCKKALGIGIGVLVAVYILANYYEDIVTQALNVMATNPLMSAVIVLLTLWQLKLLADNLATKKQSTHMEQKPLTPPPPWPKRPINQMAAALFVAVAAVTALTFTVPAVGDPVKALVAENWVLLAGVAVAGLAALYFYNKQPAPQTANHKAKEDMSQVKKQASLSIIGLAVMGNFIYQNPSNWGNIAVSSLVPIVAMLLIMMYLDLKNGPQKNTQPTSGVTTPTAPPQIQQAV